MIDIEHAEARNPFRKDPAKGAEKMRRLFLVVSMVLLSGCHNVSGPLQPKPPERVDDPLLTIGEQERKGRANLPLPIESPRVAPPSAAAIPGTPTYGR